MKTIAVGMSRDHGAVSRRACGLLAVSGVPCGRVPVSFGFLPPSQMPHSETGGW